MMETLDVIDANSAFSQVVERALSNGGEMLVTQAGQPVLWVSPYKATPAKINRRIGAYKGRIHLTEGWDEWPEEEARALGIID